MLFLFAFIEEQLLSALENKLMETCKIQKQ